MSYFALFCRCLPSHCKSDYMQLNCETHFLMYHKAFVNALLIYNLVIVDALMSVNHGMGDLINTNACCSNA